MSTRAELEAVLAKAETAWQKANDALRVARAVELKANAEWVRVAGDRRKSGNDRRKSTAVWHNAFPDRRKANTERRISESDIAVLSRLVTERNVAYTDRGKAVEERVQAEARLKTASAERDRVIAELEKMKRL
ncbi:MAG: hypothetical protein IH604_11820 [Burkholderiales bacterium]|nr:hypothetical protein [Burkholderiales bacterium]